MFETRSRWQVVAEPPLHRPLEVDMNSSLITADPNTHLKILSVAVSAATLFVWIGMRAEGPAPKTIPTGQQFEMPTPQPRTPSSPKSSHEAVVAQL